MILAVCQHLNISPKKIKRLEEWPNVIFAVIQGLGGRFISKKVVQVKEDTPKLKTKICKRSGLQFETENGRLQVHPKITPWTTCKDLKVRYAAVEIIDRGKAEGWDSLEKFEKEISLALNPPVEEKKEVDWNLYCSNQPKGKRGYVALITGRHPQFNWERQFLDSVNEEGRNRYFSVKENGCYEAVTYSQKNKYTTYYRYSDSKLQEISLEELEKFFPCTLKSSDALSKVVEECWECGATYTTYGNVEWGGMCCRSCR